MWCRKSNTIMMACLIFGCNFQSVVYCGPIGDGFSQNPESLQQLVETGTYEDILSFAQSAYLESQGSDGEIAQYAYMVVLQESDPDKQWRLVTEFALLQADMASKSASLNIIINRLRNGLTLDPEAQTELVSLLTDELEQINQASSESFRLGNQIAEALVWVGVDDGLDVILTNSQLVRNLQVKDSWSPDSDASQFASLRDNYNLIGSEPSNSNPEPDLFTAKLYDLMRLRRANGGLVKPLDPLANLDQLSPY